MSWWEWGYNIPWLHLVVVIETDKRVTLSFESRCCYCVTVAFSSGCETDIGYFSTARNCGFFLTVPRTDKTQPNNNRKATVNCWKGEDSLCMIISCFSCPPGTYILLCLGDMFTQFFLFMLQILTPERHTKYDLACWVVWSIGWIVYSSFLYRHVTWLFAYVALYKCFFQHKRCFRVCLFRRRHGPKALFLHK